MGHLAHRIVRTRIKNSGRRKPASPESEPDFYKMPTVPRNQNDTVIGSVNRDCFALRTLLRPTDAPGWQMNSPMVSHGMNMLESRQEGSLNPPGEAFPDLLAAFNPSIASRARDAQENPFEAECMRQLLEPITDFDAF